MATSVKEQETTINIMRDEDTARIYTSDTIVMVKLDKFVNNDAYPDWKLIEEIHSKDGDLVAKVYETKKHLISFRSSTIVRNLTEEQRKEFAERIRKAREEKTK